MSLKPYRLPSLRDKIEGLSNEELKEEIKELKKPVKKVEQKKKKHE